MLPCLGKLNDFFAVITFAVIVRQQAVAFGPQGFIFQRLGVDSGDTFFVQGFDNLGRNAGNQGIRRYDGAFGYNSTGSNDRAVADYSAVKYGRMHADEAVVLNGAGMEQSAVAYSYIITDDAGVVISNVQHAVVLDIAVAANLDAVNVAADSNAGPDAGVLLKLNLANQGSSIKGVGLLVNFGGLCFKFENHLITTFYKLAAFAAVLKDKQFLLTLLLSYEQIIKSRRSHLFCRCEGLDLVVGGR